MFPPYYFYWFRLDNKHITKPRLDQALMDYGAISLIMINVKVGSMYN